MRPVIASCWNGGLVLGPRAGRARSQGGWRTEMAPGDPPTASRFEGRSLLSDGSLENEHAIPVTEEPVLCGNGLPVAFQHQITAGEGADKHE